MQVFVLNRSRTGNGKEIEGEGHECVLRLM